MSPRLWVVALISFADLVYCQGSKENPINCELNGQNLTNGTTIHYKHGNQSIIICKAPRSMMSNLELEHETEQNTRGILKKMYGADAKYHVVGIRLSHAPDHVQLNGLLVNGINSVGGFHLNFVATSGHPPAKCHVDPPKLGRGATREILPHDGPIQCMLNNMPLMNRSTIQVTAKCQLNIIKCTINKTVMFKVFSPEDQHQKSAAWVPYNANAGAPSHVIMLQIKDIVRNSATEVKMTGVSSIDYNDLPFPFLITISNQISDPCPDTTTTIANTATTLATTGTLESQTPTVLDINKGLSTSTVVGSAVGAILVGALIVVAVTVLGVMLVYCTKRGRKQPEPLNKSMNESGVENGDVYNYLK